MMLSANNVAQPLASRRPSRSVVAARALARPSIIKAGSTPRRSVQAHVLAETAVATRQEDVRPVPTGGDPWEDERWRTKKWTVYRGVAYDLTPYMDRHPGGSWLINLAIGRDCTALFESYHLRPEVAVSHLKRLPVMEDFPVDAVPRSPYPNDSPIYNAIRDRVRKELFKGQDGKGAHRSGSEGAALAVLGYAAAAYALYTVDCNPITGLMLGLAGAWIGLTIQHCGNHGAMSTNPLINNALGMTDDLIGGSSLMWRYHHQVSHHIHCNDEAFDEDVMNAFPFLRFDNRQPKYWYHQFQHVYMWATFPFLMLVFQIGDIKALLENRTVGATLYGATNFEKGTVVAGKIAFWALLLGLPMYLHGTSAALIGAASYMVTSGIVLAATFAVSHNVPEAKPLDQGPARDNMLIDATERDWGLQQILTSANWGGVVGNFFTGGLNLQIEHHLFPAIAFMHYPAISKIVEDECKKRGVQYAHYGTLPEILGRFVRYMKEVGSAEQVPMKRSSASDAALLSKF